MHDIENGEFYFEQDTKNKIIGWMNGFYKDTTAYIQHNSKFFLSLSNITHIVVMGHSLNNIDMPYFEAVANKVNQNVKWIFYWHSDTDIKKIDTLARDLGIKEVIKKYW